MAEFGGNIVNRIVEESYLVSVSLVLLLSKGLLMVAIVAITRDKKTKLSLF